jgi:hypothetical protein
MLTRATAWKMVQHAAAALPVLDFPLDFPRRADRRACRRFRWELRASWQSSLRVKPSTKAQPLRRR